MLMVSDMLEVARGGSSSSSLRAKSPRRFNPTAFKAPVVVWNVNRDCNMVCPHCYAAARPGLGTNSKGELSTAEGKALLEELAAFGVKMVIFSGGEPLLRADLPELLAHAASLGLVPNLSTNGTLITKDIVAVLKAAGAAYVGVSIDGPAEFNDGYRGLEDGHALALRGLRLAREGGLRTGLRMTLTRRNMQYLEDMLAQAIEVGAHRFYVAHLVYAGRGYRMMGDDLSAEETRASLWRLFEMSAAMLDNPAAPRVVTGSNDSGGPLLLRWLAGQQEAGAYGEGAMERVAELLGARGGNSAGEGVVAIDARGRVHPDQFWHQAVLGDVRQQSMASIMGHPLVADLRRRESLLHGRCGDCAFKGMCRGSHRERALARHGDIWAPDPGCVMRDDEILNGAATMQQAV